MNCYALASSKHDPPTLTNHTLAVAEASKSTSWSLPPTFKLLAWASLPAIFFNRVSNTRRACGGGEERRGAWGMDKKFLHECFSNKRRSGMGADVEWELQSRSFLNGS